MDEGNGMGFGSRQKIKRYFFISLEILIDALILIIFLMLFYHNPFRDLRGRNLDAEGKSNLMAIHAQLEVEKQLSTNHSFPLQDCVGTQVANPPTKLCPDSVCPQFHYTSPIGAEDAEPQFCFIVTEIKYDPDDPNVIVGYTIQAQGRTGRVEGAVVQTDEDGTMEVVKK